MGYINTQLRGAEMQPRMGLQPIRNSAGWGKAVLSTFPGIQTSLRTWNRGIWLRAGVSIRTAKRPSVEDLGSMAQ